MKSKETYLGDGLYAAFDGHQIRLWAPRERGNDEVYLDAYVMQAFLKFVREINPKSEGCMPPMRPECGEPFSDQKPDPLILLIRQALTHCYESYPAPDGHPEYYFFNALRALDHVEGYINIHIIPAQDAEPLTTESEGQAKVEGRTGGAHPPAGAISDAYGDMGFLIDRLRQIYAMGQSNTPVDFVAGATNILSCLGNYGSAAEVCPVCSGDCAGTPFPNPGCPMASKIS